MTPTPVEAIYQCLRHVPPGKVVTYGQLAKLAGLSSAARFVGTTLKKLPKDTQLPWFRVINAQGKISFPEDHPHYSRQKHLLEKDGVEFYGNKVSLSQYQWQP